MSREEFRVNCVDRDGGECLVPWCDSTVTVDPDGPGEVHHIIERKLWSDGGYIEDNGACVCNEHHRLAERDEIPPQAFWRWAGIDEPTIPNVDAVNAEDTLDTITIHVEDTCELIAIDKWGVQFETPPHGDLRQYPKYPSTRHLMPLYWQSERGTADERTGRDDTGIQSVNTFLDVPLVVTAKMDGSNTMIVSDTDEPVRARNGRDADHESFDYLKQEYWDRNVHENLPEHLQVFGENMYAKHSIHYGCDGCCDVRNQGPPVDDVFLVFGVYDTRYDMWLSWPETEDVAEQIGFPTVPVLASSPVHSSHPFEKIVPFGSDTHGSSGFVEYMTRLAEDHVDRGHEGVVVRSALPFHYGMFEHKVGKYVRPNHVQTDEHWSHADVVRNEIRKN